MPAAVAYLVLVALAAGYALSAGPDANLAAAIPLALTLPWSLVLVIALPWLRLPLGGTAEASLVIAVGALLNVAIAVARRRLRSSGGWRARIGGPGMLLAVLLAVGWAVGRLEPETIVSMVPNQATIDGRTVSGVLEGLEDGERPDYHEMARAVIAAARVGDAEALRKLLDAGGDPGAGRIVADTDGRGHTALMQAAGACHPQTVRLLLERGADVNARPSNRYNSGTALSHVAGSVRNALAGYPNPKKLDCFAVVKLLVEHGADIGLFTPAEVRYLKRQGVIEATY